MITAEFIAELIGRGRYDLTSESMCQRDIDTLLAASLPLGVSLQREYRLGPHDRPDFLVGGRIVVEVKMNGAQPAAILRQLKRYAIYRDVEAVILASNRAMRLPATLEGKPAHFVSLAWAWL